MQNHTLSSAGSKTRKRKRIGRGDASGNGSYSGKGMKGQKSRSGGGVRPGFEGGQLPLIKRLPSLRGFTNIFKTQYHAVNLDTILKMYPNGGDVSPGTLVETGVLKDQKLPLKVLGRGEINVNLKVSAHKFTKSAKQKIETAGGTIQVIE
ncbi:MAG: 50S ribosomal protein L15 [Chloroflexota bacterium]|nr:MAG: 50S ribosomal protein L15 [SAR202 cluster bacterium]MEC7734437.1 50S ribosomal protein L15 [Chloroflexota bacterium]MED5409785.1 50S ribosomal protein L15 [Chloroflexota bacterium]MEE3344956.1 50S ribosomal protein L15 [Chloroflexota bacterium]|tara:strand:+ start:4285 stop:4734 length:450 start_codon:yes stop_codon:yes gene_type:complete